MTTDELQEVRQGVERCEARHVGREHPFCENYGCMAMRQLLDELDRLHSGLVHIEQVASAALSGDEVVSTWWYANHARQVLAGK